MRKILAVSLQLHDRWADHSMKVLPRRAGKVKMGIPIEGRKP